MNPVAVTFLAPIFLIGSAAATISVPPVDPLRFFEGRTETEGQVKVMFRQSYESHSIGQGRIEPDGSLTLVQRVYDQGKPPHERRWRVRQVGPGRYTGTMTEAAGPVAIEKVGERYRFHFKMPGRLSVEQVLTPLPGGRSARTSTKVRKLGMVVATTDGIVRKL